MVGGARFFKCPPPAPSGRCLRQRPCPLGTSGGGRCRPATQEVVGLSKQWGWWFGTFLFFLNAHHPPPPVAAYGSALARWLPKEHEGRLSGPTLCFHLCEYRNNRPPSASRFALTYAPSGQRRRRRRREVGGGWREIKKNEPTFNPAPPPPRATIRSPPPQREREGSGCKARAERDPGGVRMYVVGSPTKRNAADAAFSLPAS